MKITIEKYKDMFGPKIRLKLDGIIVAVGWDENKSHQTISTRNGIKGIAKILQVVDAAARTGEELIIEELPAALLKG